jgi:hypothetical protein
MKLVELRVNEKRALSIRSVSDGILPTPKLNASWVNRLICEALGNSRRVTKATRECQVRPDSHVETAPVRW